MSKAIKFKNNTYLDSSSITHNKVQLSTILNQYSGRKILEYRATTSNNFNDYYTPGIYSVGGNGWQNAPYSTSIYGVLVVLTNDGRTWQKTDSSSWLWQIFFNTSGGIYLRRGVNSTVPEGWTQLH